MSSKSHNSFYHDRTSAFFNVFSEKDMHVNAVEFNGMLKTNSQVCTVFEKSKETMLEFYKGTSKVLWII